MAGLSDAQIAQIAGKILVTRDPNTTRLPKPVTTTGGFESALSSIGATPMFQNVGIGVVDFTDAGPPKVWLNTTMSPTTAGASIPASDLPFRVGSTSKIGLILAAVQLRLDVWRVRELGFISTAAQFDALFRDPRLWENAQPPRPEIRQIAETPPRFGEIFDFGKNPVDFRGPSPDGRSDADQLALFKRLTKGHLRWSRWAQFSFSDRMWLTGALSDNVAATSCVSQIGVPYIKAVMRAYGLADHPSKGMHLLPSWHYTPIPRNSAFSTPRRLSHQDVQPVEDFWRSSAPGNQRSWVPGSAAALTAYMLALAGDAFGEHPDDGPVVGPLFRLKTSRTIRDNLSDGLHERTGSYIRAGLQSTTVKVRREISKIGILETAEGAKSSLLCEFVHLETEQLPDPAPPKRPIMKFGVVAVGLRADVPTPGQDVYEKAQSLGLAVHTILANR